MKIVDVIGGALLAALTAGAALASEPPGDAHSHTAGVAVTSHDLSQVPVADRGEVISWKLVTNGPVPDTPSNRARYEPLSHAGRETRPAGN